MDRLGSILLVAGLACFALAFVLSGVYPYMITDARHEEASIVEMAQDVPEEFRQLKQSWPVTFASSFEGAEGALTVQDLLAVPEGDPARAASEDAWRSAYADALRQGRNVYVAEGCWHCHSQYVRPVANEDVRFGPVLLPEHDNNELQRPVLWGTRRVGPDLTHEGRLRSNDWHMAHLWDPESTSPGSVMPAYPWFFREGWQVRRRIAEEVAERTGFPPGRSYPYPGLWETREEAEAAMARLKEELPPGRADEAERMFVERATGPGKRALALVAYLQWLGTWTPPHLEEGTP